MRRFRVVLDPDAETDAREAFVWYQARNPEAADRFEAELGSVLDALADAPRGGPEVELGVRRVILDRFPYAIFYTLGADHVLVLAVAHLKRRPGYWRSRRK